MTRWQHDKTRILIRGLRAMANYAESADLHLACCGTHHRSRTADTF